MALAMYYFRSNSVQPTDLKSLWSRKINSLRECFGALSVQEEAYIFRLQPKCDNTVGDEGAAVGHHQHVGELDHRPPPATGFAAHNCNG